MTAHRRRGGGAVADERDLPLEPVRGRWSRSWGHFVRRPRRTQVRTVVLIGAVVAGVAVWLATSPSSTSSGSTATATPTTTHAASGPVPVSAASTSTRGIDGNSINVVFPVVSLNSLAGQEGFAADPEYGEQTKAIQFYVKQINDSGGINGRHINPIITTFDPTNETAMRALCKTWTEGSPAAFAVLDGIGDWTGDNELCITQEGQTPFIGAVDHRDQLDRRGLALPLVDRAGPVGDPPGGRRLGAQRRTCSAAREWSG